MAHQVGDLQGQDAGEDMHPDVVAGPVVHGRERDDVRVFQLTEGEFGSGSHANGETPVLCSWRTTLILDVLRYRRIA